MTANFEVLTNRISTTSRIFLDKQFYILYPQIRQTLSDEFKSIDIQDIVII